MKNKLIIGIYCLLILFMITTVSAEDINDNINITINAADVSENDFYVDLGGDDSNNGYQSSPFNSIKRAIDESNPKNDITIHLNEGTFEGKNNSMITINKAHLSQKGSITIIGKGTDKTFINGMDTYYIFNIKTDSVVTFKDLSFVNCRSVDGGVILNEGTLIIDNCEFKNNHVIRNGGVISSTTTADCKIYNSLFENNTCNNNVGNSYGGAIYVNRGKILIDNCKFINNNVISSTYAQGGAVYMINAYEASVLNSIFINNSATSTRYNDSQYEPNIGSGYQHEYAKAGSLYSWNKITLDNLSFINSSVNGLNAHDGSYYADSEFLNKINNILRINSSVNGVLEPDILPYNFDENQLIYYISPNGDDINGNGSVKNPYATINHTLNVARQNTSNLKIILLEGTYKSGGNTKLELAESMNIELCGSGKVILDGENNWFIHAFKSLNNFKYYLNNLNFINFKSQSFGNLKTDNLGMITTYVDFQVNNCTFENINGVVFSNFDLANLFVENSKFYNNTYHIIHGSIVFNYDAGAVFSNCLIDNCYSYSLFESKAVNTDLVDLKIINTTISNSCSSGIVSQFIIRLSNCNLTLSNVIYRNNTVSFISGSDESYVNIYNSTFENNELSSFNHIIWNVDNSSFISNDNTTFNSMINIESKFTSCLFDSDEIKFLGYNFTVSNSSFKNKVVVGKRFSDDVDTYYNFNYNYWNNKNPNDILTNINTSYWILRNIDAINLFNDSYKLILSYKLFDGNKYYGYNVSKIPIKPVKFELTSTSGSIIPNKGILSTNAFETISTTNNDRTIIFNFEDNTKSNITLYNTHKVVTAIDMQIVNDSIKFSADLTDNKTSLKVDNGTLNIYLNNELIDSIAVNGALIIKDIKLKDKLAFYNITAEYIGNEKYANSTESRILRNPSVAIDTVIVSKDLVKYYKNQSQFIITLKDVLGEILSDMEVKFIINGVSYTRVTNSSGMAKLNINLESGNYTISTIFNGDLKTKASSATNKITVLSKIQTKFIDNNKFIVKLFDEKGEIRTNTSLTITVNGVTYNRLSNDTGEAKLNIRLNPSTYTIEVRDDSSVLYASIDVISTIIADDLSMFYRDGSKFSATVYSNDGDLEINKEVNISVNGVTYVRITNNAGIASLNMNLRPGIYTISVNYNSKTIYKTVSIFRMPVSIISSNVNVIQGSFYKVKFFNALGNPIKSQNAEIKVNGVSYIKTTDDTGVASLKINLQSGEYLITSSLVSKCFEDKILSNTLMVSGV